MDYITAEQFKEQPEEIQKALREWFKENVKPYDLYSISTGKRSEIICLRNDNKYIDAVKECIKDTIPLFSETQLRCFIEEKTGKITFSGMTWAGDRFIEIENEVFRSYRREEVMDKDLLQAYWKYACRLAEEAKK